MGDIIGIAGTGVAGVFPRVAFSCIGDCQEARRRDVHPWVQAGVHPGSVVVPGNGGAGRTNGCAVEGEGLTNQNVDWRGNGLDLGAI